MKYQSLSLNVPMSISKKSLKICHFIIPYHLYIHGKNKVNQTKIEKSSTTLLLLLLLLLFGSCLNYCSIRIKINKYFNLFQNKFQKYYINS